MQPLINIDPKLVERYVMEMGRHGSDGGTGVCRAVYTPEWVAATEQYTRWCQESGLATRMDAVGSVWGRLEGSGGGKAIASGSHIDSQLSGGRYDGTLGALAGLIALRALKEQFGMPRRPLEAVAFCEEEGSRFPSAGWWGSRALVGQIPPDLPAKILNPNGGESIADAMRAIGLDPARIPEARRDDIDSFIELHIEQGPILEQAGLPVAAVSGITGIRHYTVELTGDQNHAGAFPMDIRRDPMAGFAEIASGLIDTAHRWGRPAVTTIGRVEVVPNNIAAIPKSVRFSVDARHPDGASCQRLYESHERLMREVAARRGLGISWEIMIDQPACPSDPGLFDAVQQACRAQSVPFMTMASGAGHDSQQMAAAAKVVMIFVRSKDGRSHTPEEFSSVEDIVAGIRVLASTLHRLAY
jgi:allantoate deiminase